MGLETEILTVFALSIRCLCALLLFSSVRSHLKISTIVTVSISLSIYGVFFLKLNIVGFGYSEFYIFQLCISEGLKGFIASCPFVIATEIFPYSARIIELVRGAQFAEQHAPLIEGRSCLLEITLVHYGMVYFLFYLSSNFLCNLFGFDLGTDLTNIGFFRGLGGCWENLVRQYCRVLSSGIKMVAPFIALCLCLDIAVGLISRFSDRLSLASEAIALKLLMGLLFLASYMQILGEIDLLSFIGIKAL